MTATNDLIFDCDGHVLENPMEIGTFLKSPYREYIERSPFGLFPPLDKMHTSMMLVKNAFVDRGRELVGPDKWIDFLDDVGVGTTVLYPTMALAAGKFNSVDWAIQATAAYNDWLHHTYQVRDPRFKGMAVLPMQDPEAAAAELRRCVLELGMPGATLPSNGLKVPLGHSDFDPVYQAADELGCALAVHGGCHDNWGMDQMQYFAGIHALGHPHGIMISVVDMLFEGVFDRFTNVRFGFLEAGVAWLLHVLERLDGSYKGFMPYEPPGTRIIELDENESLSEYLIRKVKGGQVFFGCEGDEAMLGTVIKIFGGDRFLWSSDFPHEVTAESCKHEIEELLEAEDISDEDKHKVLHENGANFYRATAVPA